MINQEFQNAIDSLSELRTYKNNFKENILIKSIKVYEKKCDEEPLVSLVIPTANRSETLIETLKSINSNKKIFPFEVIIVDNSGYIENSLLNEKINIVKSFSFDAISYYINEANIGMVGNFNRCYELARAEWIGMIHDDDLITDSYMEEIYRCLHNSIVDEKTALIKTRYLFFRDGEQFPHYDSMNRGGLRKINKFDTLIKGTGPTAAPTCGMLIRKKAIIEVGGYCKAFYPSMDHILGYQFQKKGYKTLETEDVLGYYRICDNASTKKETFIGFAIMDTVFRRYLYEDNRFFRMIGLLFEKLNYRIMVDKLLYLARMGLNDELKISDVDFLNSYDKCYIRNFIYRIVKKSVNQFIRNRVYI